jgi:drug/metabolite transporter (DMT)-like permease
MNKMKRGFIELNLATFLFGFIGVIAKSITLPTPLIILFRGIFAFLALSIFFMLRKEKLSLKRNLDYVLMFLLGLLFAVHWLALFEAIRVSNIAAAYIAFFTFPAMTVFLEPLFTKERLCFWDVVTGIVISIGIWFLVPEFDLSNDVTRGVMWGILAAFTYALRNIFTRKYFRKASGASIMFYQILVTVLVCLPFLFFDEFVFVPLDFVYIILLGVVFTAIAHSFFVRSLKVLKAKSVGMITSMQPVYAVFFAYVFLNEIPDWRTAIGGALILLAVLFEILKVGRKIRAIDLEDAV